MNLKYVYFLKKTWAMKYEITSLGIRFTKHRAKEQTPFERLFEIFKELITHTSGDFDEAIDWLRELDREYKLDR